VSPRAKVQAKTQAPGLLDQNQVAKQSAPVIAGGITLAMVADAEAFCRRQRLAFAKWLQIDTSKLEDGDRELSDRVLATVDGDGTGYEKALAFQPVNDLFARGVLKFVRPISQAMTAP